MSTRSAAHDRRKIRLASRAVVLLSSRLFACQESAAKGSDGRCGKFGAIVERLSTDRNGRLSLNRLKAGDYWVTYIDAQHGESLHVSLVKGKNSGGPFELQLDHIGGFCYLVDVERNATKPPTGWPKPRPETSDAQTN